MMKVAFWIVVLIALYLFAKNALGFNTLIGTLASNGLKGIAVLQGRDNVSGVTV